MWRRYLKLAHGFTAAHPDGIVKYTAPKPHDAPDKNDDGPTTRRATVFVF